MSILTYKHRITINGGVKQAIVVYLENDQKIKFTRWGHWLYYFDTTNASPAEMPQYKITENKTIDKSKSSVAGYSFFCTVASSKEYFTQHKVEGADNTRLLQERIVWPDDQ